MSGLCATCGHSHSSHPLRSCRVPKCPCMRYVEDHGKDLPVLPPETSGDSWQSMVMMGVLEHVVNATEGEVHVKTNDGRECIVKLTMRPSVSITCAGGKA